MLREAGLQEQVARCQAVEGIGFLTAAEAADLLAAIAALCNRRRISEQPRLVRRRRPFFCPESLTRKSIPKKAMYESLLLNSPLIKAITNAAAGRKPMPSTGRVKTDPSDARLLSRFLKNEGEDLRPWSPPPAVYGKLQSLLRRRAALVTARTATSAPTINLPACIAMGGSSRYGFSA